MQKYKNEFSLTLTHSLGCFFKISSQTCRFTLPLFSHPLTPSTYHGHYFMDQKTGIQGWFSLLQSIIQSEKASLHYLLLWELEVVLGCDRTCPWIPVHDSWELAYFKNNILIHNETEKSQRNNKEVCYI